MIIASFKHLNNLTLIQKSVKMNNQNSIAMGNKPDEDISEVIFKAKFPR